MTATEFYNEAVNIAQERGFTAPDITTGTACFSGRLRHYCQLWILDKRKFVHSGHHNNVSAALQAFADAIDFENKSYDKTVEDIEVL